ncbi:MAG: hypothetical protein WBC40_08950 [Halobacteriota archaeon]
MECKLDPEFEKEIREIYYFITRYGIEKVDHVNLGNKQSQEKIIKECHKGYGIAQERILKNLLKLERVLRDKNHQLKRSRRNRDSKESHKLAIEISSIDFRISVFHKLADAIAWILMGGEKYIARRFYLGKPCVRLLDSNIESVRKESDELNKNGLRFALISDLTSVIQIGDLCVIDFSEDKVKIELIEVKEGKMNEICLNFIDSLVHTKCPRSMYYFHQQYGEKSREQVLRILKQREKGMRAIEILKEGKGEDYQTGRKIKIPDKPLKLEFYDDFLLKGISRAKEKGWYYGTFDGCIWIGVYLPSVFPDPSIVFRLACLADISHIKEIPIEKISEKEDMILPYPVVDIRQGFYTPLAIPLFLRNIPPEYILDIIMGRIQILLYFDFDIWFKMAENIGIGGKWSTRKQASKQKRIIKDIFCVKNRIPMLEVNGREMYAGDGILVRVLFDGITPKSALSFFRNKEEDGNVQENDSGK